MPQACFVQLRDHGWHRVINQKPPKFVLPVDTSCGIHIEQYKAPIEHGLLVIAYTSTAPKVFDCQKCLAAWRAEREKTDNAS